LIIPQKNIHQNYVQKVLPEDPGCNIKKVHPGSSESGVSFAREGGIGLDNLWVAVWLGCARLRIFVPESRFRLPARWQACSPRFTREVFFSMFSTLPDRIPHNPNFICCIEIANRMPKL